jgi:phosphoribosylformylglycinamidine synthase
LEEGKAALEKLNKEMGLALDEWDIEYYTNLFTDKVKRNPTTVELFDISQSNSEHSRHWFFRGRYAYLSSKFLLFACFYSLGEFCVG